MLSPGRALLSSLNTLLPPSWPDTALTPLTGLLKPLGLSSGTSCLNTSPSLQRHPPPTPSFPANPFHAHPATLSPSRTPPHFPSHLSAVFLIILPPVPVPRTQPRPGHRLFHDSLESPVFSFHSHHTRPCPPQASLTPSRTPTGCPPFARPPSSPSALAPAPMGPQNLPEGPQPPLGRSLTLPSPPNLPTPSTRPRAVSPPAPAPNVLQHLPRTLRPLSHPEPPVPGPPTLPTPSLRSGPGRCAPQR